MLIYMQQTLDLIVERLGADENNRIVSSGILGTTIESRDGREFLNVISSESGIGDVEGSVIILCMDFSPYLVTTLDF